jgi:hypothetical protein
MMMFQATGDLSKVSLWLGDAYMQTTEIYLRADPTEKIEGIEAVTPPALRRGSFTVLGRWRWSRLTFSGLMLFTALRLLRLSRRRSLLSLRLDRSGM